MRQPLLWLVVGVALAFGGRLACAAEMRFALVVGNDEYKAGKLATPANDAGLVANALQAAGFTVTGARNLDQSTLRESFREFLGQVAQAGPDAVALVYLAGYGLQFAGDNFFVPVDADIQHDVDVPLQAIRISDFVQPLAALPARVKIVIVDAARQNPLARGGQPLASGLALVDPAQGMAFAFNAAPGTVGEDEPGPYGAYATALTEMIAAGGLSLDDLFARVRLRVSEVTKGAEVPWFASRIDGPFFMTERAADAPPLPNVVSFADLRSKPIRAYSGVEDAYAAAVSLDTIEAYEEFLAVYRDGPFARRVRAMIAVRREEIIWLRCIENDTPPAYWTYVRRYPNGPHVWDARRRLAILHAQYDAPPSFAVVDFGYPPPPPDEIIFVDRPILIFAGPDFAPPPPPPVFFLPVRPREFVALPPPPPSRERFALPVAAIAVPVFVKPPRTVAVRPVPPGAGAGPGGRPITPVALPAAAAKGVPGEREERRGGPPAGPAGIVTPPPGRAVAPPAPTAAVKPASPPPREGATTTAVKPAPPPPREGATTTAVKPAPPPPPPRERATTTAVKPAPPPPPPPREGSSTATVKPSPSPPPHPAAPAAASVKPPPAGPKPPAKPACPPGKRETPEGCK